MFTWIVIATNWPSDLRSININTKWLWSKLSSWSISSSIAHRIHHASIVPLQEKYTQIETGTHTFHLEIRINIKLCKHAFAIKCLKCVFGANIFGFNIDQRNKTLLELLLLLQLTILALLLLSWFWQFLESMNNMTNISVEKSYATQMT